MNIIIYATLTDVSTSSLSPKTVEASFVKRLNIVTITINTSMTGCCNSREIFFVFLYPVVPNKVNKLASKCVSKYVS